MEKLRESRIKLLVAAAAILFAVAVNFTAGPKITMAKAGDETSTSMRYDGGSDYVAQCTRCHGGDGRGNTAKGRQTHAGDLTKSRVSDTKGIRMIANGSGEMPAFKDSMSAAQIRAVMAYVKGFRR